MSRSTDAGHFFQTTDALATTERKAAKAKNQLGKPIKLGAKILAVCAAEGEGRSGSGRVLVALATGEVKEVCVETSTVKRLAAPAAAPLTCLALSPERGMLWTGCWDKNIYGVPLAPSSANTSTGTGSTSTSASKTVLKGHTDFVKTLLVTSLNGHPILLSGSADATIIVWDLTNNKALHKLKGHTKALQHLAVDPFSLPEGSAAPGESFVLFSASSDREIRRWTLSLESAEETKESIEHPILAHETSVYSLWFDGDGDLWTASADKTAKHLVRERGWESDTVLPHGDFVRDVVAVDGLGVVVTACRDEGVRVWDAGSGEVRVAFEGHFEEVMGLCVLGGGERVVSVGIDGTVRTWGLGGEAIEAYREEVRREGGQGEEVVEGKKEGMLTAEEEAELAELMGSDDE